MEPSSVPGCDESPLSAKQASSAHLSRLASAIKRHARRLGFDHCRIAPIELALHADYFERWLAAGYAGDMAYLHRNVDKRRNPLLLTDKDSAPYRSIIVVAVNYYQFALPPALRDDPSRGVIASYAWADDYHEIIRPLLYDLDEFVRAQTGRTSKGKCLVDSGPVLERDWALRSGLGFTGKNCCTIRPKEGSWLFLATIMVPEKLDYDPFPVRQPQRKPSQTESHNALPSPLDGLAHDADFGAWSIDDAEPDESAASSRTYTGGCGRCTRCLTACPTAAFRAPFELDARKCISYWTIETQAPVPRELRPQFGNRIFGCDICQEVCPWNRRLSARMPLISRLWAHHDRIAIPLLEGFHPDTPYWLDEAAYRARFRRSPILRARRHGMLRNVCIALGNWGVPLTIPALMTALSDTQMTVRGHAAWALGQITAGDAHPLIAHALAAAGVNEESEWVRTEIAAALRSAAISR